MVAGARSIGCGTRDVEGGARMYEGAPNSKHDLAPCTSNASGSAICSRRRVQEGGRQRGVREVNGRDRQSSRRHSKPLRNQYALRDLAAVQPFSAAA